MKIEPLFTSCHHRRRKKTNISAWHIYYSSPLEEQATNNNQEEEEEEESASGWKPWEAENEKPERICINESKFRSHRTHFSAHYSSSLSVCTAIGASTASPLEESHRTRRSTRMYIRTQYPRDGHTTTQVGKPQVHVRVFQQYNH